MTSAHSEISELEERLRIAELEPDPDVFQELLADNVVLISEKGELFSKDKVVQAHKPGKGPQFLRVEITNLKIVNHDTAAVVTCEGEFESKEGIKKLKFMRVWLKTGVTWQIISAVVSNS